MASTRPYRQFNFRCPADLYDQIVEVAKTEDRDLSSFARQALRRYVAEVAKGADTKVKA